MCRSSSEGSRRCPSHQSGATRARTPDQKERDRIAANARYARKKAAAGGVVKPNSRTLAREAVADDEWYLAKRPVPAQVVSTDDIARAADDRSLPLTLAQRGILAAWTQRGGAELQVTEGAIDVSGTPRAGLSDRAALIMTALHKADLLRFE